MKKISAWLIVLALTAVGSAWVIGYENLDENNEKNIETTGDNCGFGPEQNKCSENSGEITGPKERQKPRHPPFFSELSEEQREEIKEIVDDLKENNATPEEIREAIDEKLEEYGINVPTPEEMINKKIEKIEQKLEILNRIKELIQENPEISKEEIGEIIQEEFELEGPIFQEGQKKPQYRHMPEQLPEKQFEQTLGQLHERSTEQKSDQSSKQLPERPPRQQRAF